MITENNQYSGSRVFLVGGSSGSVVVPHLKPGADSEHTHLLCKKCQAVFTFAEAWQKCVYLVDSFGVQQPDYVESKRVCPKCFNSWENCEVYHESGEAKTP